MTAVITLIATLTTHADPSPALHAALRQLITTSRAEPGCLQYDLHQQPDNPRVLVMVEQWRDAEALDAHAASAHYQHFGATCGELLASAHHQHLHRLV